MVLARLESCTMRKKILLFGTLMIVLAGSFSPSSYAAPPFQSEQAQVEKKLVTDGTLEHASSSDDSGIPNAEMKAIFDEDQRVRQPQKIDWKTVNRTDTERREATKKLLSAGALHTGKD